MKLLKRDTTKLGKIQLEKDWIDVFKMYNKKNGRMSDKEQEKY